MRRHVVPAAALLAAALLVPATGGAGKPDRAAEILRKMDAQLNAARDEIFDFTMEIQDPGNPPRRVSMRVYQVGARRLITFLAPGDVKGMKVLIRSRDKMYVYLPAYRKIRRIASHARNQSLLGADFSFEDMSTNSYGGVYTPKLAGETKTHWILRLTRKPGARSPYAAIEVRVRKKDHLPDRFVYFNAAGKRLKTETRTGYTCQKGKCTAREMKMVDHTRNHWTRILRKGWKVNSGVPARTFSLRRLQKAG